MLYDFHVTQNAKNPDTVHATYLLTGYRLIPAPPPPPPRSQDDSQDTVMELSPFDATPKEDQEVRFIIVVPQEKLEGTTLSLLLHTTHL
jgi:DNA polymerase delta subunit 3